MEEYICGASTLCMNVECTHRTTHKINSNCGHSCTKTGGITGGESICISIGLEPLFYQKKEYKDDQ